MGGVKITSIPKNYLITSNIDSGGKSMLKQKQENEETITKEELRFISPLYDTTILR